MSPTSRTLNDPKKWDASRVFSLYDVDGSNTLTLDELSNALTATIGRKVSATKARSYMERFDENNDGVLDRNEFSKLVVDVKSHLDKKDVSEGEGRG